MRESRRTCWWLPSQMLAEESLKAPGNPLSGLTDRWSASALNERKGNAAFGISVCLAFFRRSGMLSPPQVCCRFPSGIPSFKAKKNRLLWITSPKGPSNAYHVRISGLIGECFIFLISLHIMDNIDVIRLLHTFLDDLRFLLCRTDPGR